jgi:hypothetical protein
MEFSGGSEVFLKELHTACELLLEGTVNRRSKRLSFAEPITCADNAGVFANHVALGRRGDGMTPVELLVQLKDLRKEVRHRTASGSHEWLAEHSDEVALLLERSVSGLNRRFPPAADGPRWWAETGIVKRPRVRSSAGSLGGRQDGRGCRDQHARPAD